MNYQRLLLGGAVLIAVLSFGIQTVSGQRSLTAVGGNPYATPSPQGSNPPVVVVRGSEATAPTPSNETSAPSNPFMAGASSNSHDPHGRWYLEQKKAPNPVETFRVSHVGADKTMLLEVFEIIKDFEETKHGKKGRNSFRVLQRLSPTEFLVHETRTDYSRNPFSSGRVGAARRTVSFKADSSQIFLLKTQQPRSAVDGEWINGIIVNDTGTVRSYTAALGNLKSVRILIEDASLEPKHAFTQEEFVRRLQSGETWTLKNFKEEDCRVCFGKGELSTFKGGGACPQCGNTQHRGKGFIDYLIRW